MSAQKAYQTPLQETYNPLYKSCRRRGFHETGRRGEGRLNRFGFGLPHEARRRRRPRASVSDTPSVDMRFDSFDSNSHTTTIATITTAVVATATPRLRPRLQSQPQPQLQILPSSGVGLSAREYLKALDAKRRAFSTSGSCTCWCEVDKPSLGHSAVRPLSGSLWSSKVNGGMISCNILGRVFIPSSVTRLE